MDGTIAQLKREYLTNQDPQIGLRLLHLMLRLGDGKEQDRRAMVFSVPKLGTTLTLLAPWTLTLHAESRNYDFWKKCHPGDEEIWAKKEKIIQLPAGTKLKVARIYIKQGQEAFNSVTFNLLSCPEGNVYQLKNKGRFWAKLYDCNRMICEFDESFPVREAPDYTPPPLRVAPKQVSKEEFLKTELRNWTLSLLAVEQLVEYHQCCGRWEAVAQGRYLRHHWAKDREPTVEDLITLTPGQILGVIKKSALVKITNVLKSYGLKLKGAGKKGCNTVVPNPIPERPEAKILGPRGWFTPNYNRGF